MKENVLGKHLQKQTKQSSIDIVENFVVTYDEEVFGEPATVISFDSEDCEQVEERGGIDLIT